MTDLAGQGSDADRAETMAKVRAAQAERGGERAEVARLQGLAAGRRPVTAEEARQAASDLKSLLEDGAAGLLGPEAVYRVADLFKRLVGGEVEVLVEVRAGRKRGVVRGRFTPRLLDTVAEAGGLGLAPETAPPAPTEVWLRRPPRLDAVAAEVRRLYEDEDLGFRAIARKLGIGCGNIYQSYHRYYEMRGLATPPRRPRGRRPRSE